MMSVRQPAVGLVLFFLLSIAFATAVPERAAAQPQRTPHHTEAIGVGSGAHAAPAGIAEPVAVWSQTISSAGAPWLRVHVASFDLGAGHLTFRSLEDGDVQRHDAASLARWSGYSAVFNGDSIEVTLHAAPGDAGLFVYLDTLVAGERSAGRASESGGLSTEEGDTGPGIESICGEDDRVPSSDPAVGRLWLSSINGVCTAWLVSTGAVLTVGHCVDLDPDELGPLLPDGILDVAAGDLVEFNVPPSDPDGTPTHPAPADQYPVDIASVTWGFNGQDVADWSIFELLPNAGNELAQHRQDFHRMTRGVPIPLAENVRITGYGTDDGSQNQIQQTDSGQYLGEVDLVGFILHQYKADTQGGNSGSPIIWESPFYGVTTTIGLNKWGVCDFTGNSGNSFEFDPLETQIRNYFGSSAEYVDAVDYPEVDPPDGTPFRAWPTVAEGLTAAAAGGSLRIVTGSYDEPLVIDQSVTLVAPVGSVVIGQ